MTQLLSRAFAKAAKLPKSDQNAFARWVLEELSSEGRWEKALAKSEKQLTMLANQALAEKRGLKPKAVTRSRS